MASVLDDPIEIETAPNPSAAVIWLHGLGADGSDFASVVPELGLSPSTAIRFVFPHAPMRPVSINGGYVMRAWYDIGANQTGFTQNPEHIAESVTTLHEYIERERARGIAVAKTIVAGFSQGGVIALHGALRCPRRLAGAIVLSAPAPYLDQLVEEAAPANAELPIFLAHGIYDPMVPFAYGENAQTLLRSRKYSVEWHPYKVEHSVNLEEIRDIGRFITKVLA